MLSLHLICVGKLKEKFYLEGAAEYLKRLSAYARVTVTELPEQRLPADPSPAQIEGALRREGEAILAKVPPASTLVALCVEGKLRSSEELARLLSDWQQTGSKHLVFVIGGSHGLHPSVKEKARLKLSMSPMTFPHHLARVMLLEQVYRAFKINEGSDYHK